MDKRLHRIYIGSFFTIGILVTALLIYNGFHYYSTPLDQRFFLPQNNNLKPSGFIGHGLGIIGSLMMIIGVSIYMIRKRVRRFFTVGYLSNWLELHIFLCTLGPILVLFHTAFKFGGIVAISFWSMTAVVLSGVIGRFLYVQIPRTIKGQVLSLKELEDINNELNKKLDENFNVNTKLLNEINESCRLDKYTKLNIKSSIWIIFSSYVSIKFLLFRLRNELKLGNRKSKEIKEILKTAKSRLVISRRIGLLQTMRKMFRYWHIVHLPFAIVMFIIMFIHIIVTVTFGYRWIF